MIGETVTGVYWRDSDTKNYADFYIKTASGKWYKLSHRGVESTGEPGTLTDFSQGFKPIMDQGRVSEARQAVDGELAILLDSGHIIHLFSTFNGEETGNNMALQTPEECAEWRDEYLEMKLLDLS